jgi:tetratricopeptide (TPR) repeat protein
MISYAAASHSLSKAIRKLSPRLSQVTKPRASFSNTTYRPSLTSTISPQTLASIQTLPEVSQALSQNNEFALDGLDRAAQVFEQFNPNGDEHKAVKFLQAQGYMQLFSYQKAVKVFISLDKLDLTQDEKFHANLAKGKLMWEQGSCDEAHAVASQLCDEAPQMKHSVSLRQGTALNCLALCRLAVIGVKDVDMIQFSSKGQSLVQQDVASQLREAEDVQDLLRMASKILFKGYKDGKQGGVSPGNDPDHCLLGLYCAASYCNQGVGELTTTLIQSASTNRPVPIESPMNAWRNALTVMDELEQDELNHLSTKQIIFLKSTKARVYCNMAWAILFSSSYVDAGKVASVTEESLTLAAEYAGLALKINDEIGNEDESLGRILCLVASCYVKAGSAVTAEGLLKSAMDVLKESPNPLKTIDARSSIVYYSKLCKSWENREADATKYEKLALECNDTLTEPWIGASSIYSGLHMFGCVDA